VKVMHDRVAAIDVHKDMVKVAVRVPGERRGTRKTGVLEFRTFYGVLQEMGRELRRRGVTHVVMEASGVYTEPLPVPSRRRFSRAYVIRCPPPLLPGFSACPPSGSSKIIPCMSREDGD